jgi:hypothetical protein
VLEVGVAPSFDLTRDVRRTSGTSVLWRLEARPTTYRFVAADLTRDEVDDLHRLEAGRAREGDIGLARGEDPVEVAAHALKGYGKSVCPGRQPTPSSMSLGRP